MAGRPPLAGMGVLCLHCFKHSSFHGGVVMTIQLIPATYPIRKGPGKWDFILEGVANKKILYFSLERTFSCTKFLKVEVYLLGTIYRSENEWFIYGRLTPKCKKIVLSKFGFDSANTNWDGLFTGQYSLLSNHGSFSFYFPPIDPFIEHVETGQFNMPREIREMVETGHIVQKQGNGITDQQMGAIKGFIADAQDGTNFAKRLMTWMLNQSHNMSYAVVIEFDKNDPLGKNVLASWHEMVSSNGETHLATFIQAIRASLRFTAHNFGNEDGNTIIYLSQKMYDAQGARKFVFGKDIDGETIDKVELQQ